MQNFSLFKYSWLFVWVLWACTQQPISDELNEAIYITNATVDAQQNPINIGSGKPQFGWRIVAPDLHNVEQVAYQIIVASSLELLSEDKADLWNSGKVKSNANQWITFGGKTLDSKDQCYWKVRSWTNQGVIQWSGDQFFSISLLNEKDWKGRWIGFDRSFPWESEEKYPIIGARYFRNEFQLEQKKILSATAYVVGLGLYEFFLNGEKVGNSELTPAPTDYFHNVKFQAYDVTKLLKSGDDNAVGVAVGNGRYYAMRQYKPYKIKTFGYPKMKMHLVVTYEDGEEQVVWSDDKWKGTADGPIRNNNEYDGEYYDATKELGNWTQAGYDDRGWLQAEYVQVPEGSMEAQQTPAMKVMKTIAPLEILPSKDGFILDMGQNFAGWLKIHLAKGVKGKKITLRFAESLEEDGSLFVTNLRDAKQTDTYVMKGESDEVWEPSFTYHGFRYVEVIGYPGKPQLSDFTGQVIYDDLKMVGSFETSNKTINQIYKNAVWGIASNYKGMPVDCPQRNERQPWLGDHAVGAGGENFIFANAPLYKKWLQDIRLSQRGDGAISDVAPAYWRYYSDNMTWPGTMLIIAEMLYQHTADTSVIADNYDAMKKWLIYMKDRYQDENGIITKDSYGDWCVPPATIEEGVGKNADVKRPSKLIATAYYYHFMNMMQEFATVIGKVQDVSYWSAEAKVTKTAFNQAYYQAESYYGERKLTDQLLPLAFGLVEEKNEAAVFETVAEIINEHEGHLSTGLIGTQWIMRTLSQYGRSDLAYQLATNTTYPSWGYMIENGATAIWELWHGNVANPKMNSQNHVMLLGDLIVWYYENLAGIKAAAPGFAEIEMKPEFITSLDFVEASHESIAGTIQSVWERKKQGAIAWKISIPANAKAKVYLPKEAKVKELTGLEFPSGKIEGDYLVIAIGSGAYHLQLDLK